MFKNLMLYRADKGLEMVTDSDAVAANAFVPTAPTQELSTGWVPPRGFENGALVERVASQLILRLAIETRRVPANMVNRAVDQVVKSIEQNEGRKPGRKEMREIRDETVFSLLPQAFPELSHVLVWINPFTQLVAIDASSQSKADEVVTALVRTFEGLSISLVNTKLSPAAAMTQWLSNQEEEIPGQFTLGRETELKSNDESKATVKFTHHSLYNDELRAHIQQGKLPTKLQLQWEDKVSFTLTEGLSLRKIALLDEAHASMGDASGFDADVAISTGTLGLAISELLDEALGGLLLEEASA